MIYDGILVLGTVFVFGSSVYFLWRALRSDPLAARRSVQAKIHFTAREIAMALRYAERPPLFNVRRPSRAIAVDLVFVHAIDGHLDVYRRNAIGVGRSVGGLDVDRADILFDKVHGPRPILHPMPEAA